MKRPCTLSCGVSRSNPQFPAVSAHNHGHELYRERQAGRLGKVPLGKIWDEFGSYLGGRVRRHLCPKSGANSLVVLVGLARVFLSSSGGELG